MTVTSGQEDPVGKISPYADYLSLSRILTSQIRRSEAHGDPIHDETLFIIIHQNIELWFLQVILELKYCIESIQRVRLDDARDGLVRVQRIFAVLTLTWDVLATLRVRDFWRFRKYFLKDSASGLQSRQFRDVEFLLGVGPKQRHADSPTADVARSLWDEVNLLLKGRGVELPIELDKDRDWTESYPFVGEDDEGNISGCTAVEDHWYLVYSEPSAHRDLYELGERLLDVSSALTTWRSKHIITVQRYIGDLGGSGGTDGVRYLRKTTRKRAFPELWSVRNRFEEWLSQRQPQIQTGRD